MPRMFLSCFVTLVQYVGTEDSAERMQVPTCFKEQKNQALLGRVADDILNCLQSLIATKLVFTLISFAGEKLKTITLGCFQSIFSRHHTNDNNEYTRQSTLPKTVVFYFLTRWCIFNTYHLIRLSQLWKIYKKMF